MAAAYLEATCFMEVDGLREKNQTASYLQCCFQTRHKPAEPKQRLKLKEHMCCFIDLHHQLAFRDTVMHTHKHCLTKSIK